MKKIKYAFISMLIILILNIFSFSVLSVGSGEQTDLIEDYDDESAMQSTAQDTYYGSQFITTQDTDLAVDGIVTTAQKHSGTQSFYTGRSGYDDGALCTDTYINFTENNIITYLTFWVYWNFDSGNNVLSAGEIYHFMSNTDELFAIHHKKVGTSAAQRAFYYEDFTGINSIGNINGLVWQQFNITRNDNDSFTFVCNAIDHTGSIITLTEYGNITQIWIEHWGGDGVAYEWNLYIDDIEIETGGTDSDEEEATIPPCTPYDTIGKLNVGGTYRGTAYKYMWCVYGVSRKMYINHLDLEIDANMGDLISNTHVYCKINEYNLGHATSLVQISDSSYRLSWSGFNALINNTPTSISFKFTQTFGTGTNRAIIPISGYDINSDGYRFIVFYNNDGYYNNHGQHIYDTPEGFGNTETIIYDPIVRMCIDTIANSELNPDLINTIVCTPDNISVGEHTKIIYTVDADSYSSNMFINVQKVGSANTSFAKINTQSSYVQYTGLSEGDYYANLSIDGVTVASDTFTVFGSIDDYVFTIPNPSLPNSWFTLYYNYSKADYGSIRIFDSKDTLIKTYPIDPTSSGNMQVQLSAGSYLIKLCKIVDTGTGTVYVSVFDYPHSVFTNQIAFIDVLPKVSPTAYPVLIWGQHSHIGQNVIIRWGETEIRNVANEQQFSFYYNSEKQGSFPLELVIINENGSRTVLSSVELTFNDGYYDDVEKDMFRKWLDNIPTFYKVLIGIILTIIGFLLPYIMLIKLNANRKIPVQFNISATLSLCTGLFTSCASAYIGFYGWEFPAIGIMLILLSVFIMYIMGNRSGGG